MKSFHYYLLSILLLLLTSFGLQSCLDSTGPEQKEPKETYSHTLNPGVAANDFLADSNYTDLVVEIDYMPGYAPNERALDSLKAFFQQRTQKHSITIKKPTEISSGGQNQYSANEIRNLESEQRSTFTKEDTLAAYFVILDGKYSEKDILGLAYYNTSNAFFGPSYDDASSGTGSPSRFQIEALSFRHEFGHLFGLVDVPNSGTEMQTPHKDPDHGNHCDNDQCLMYYATETTDLVENTFSDEEIPPLDDNCIADLQANGGK
ncbi:hypothetical protein [Fodinibius saliphilus]|uniref:hypothetical protein n=1 Tax=Fodinibius saliphilus TaxID=1920650 RepID=UPI001109204D|nr:hypothetical protein [Fodinibius saliphilus]